MQSFNEHEINKRIFWKAMINDCLLMQDDFIFKIKDNKKVRFHSLSVEDKRDISNLFQYVPLSRDLLEKNCGFKSVVHSDRYDFIYRDIIIVCDREVSIFSLEKFETVFVSTGFGNSQKIIIRPTILTIKYLHELQQIIRLMYKEELDIKFINA